jgi:hypothetical protein
MIVTCSETFATEHVALVRVRTNDGDEGWDIEINPEWMALSDYRVDYKGSRF